MSEDRIQVVRSHLSAGRPGKALGALGDIVETTHDPLELRAIREIALEGLEQAGRFGKGPWKRVAGLAEKRLATA